MEAMTEMTTELKAKDHVAVDLDDVTVDFWGGIGAAFELEYDVAIPPMHPWSPDAVAFGKHLLFKESGFKDWWGWLREREWLWARFPPIAGAIGGIARLREAGWYVEAVTSKPKWAEHNVWKWLGHYRPPFNAVTIIDNKQSKVDFTDATVIVDDKLATCQSFNEHGRDAVLFDRHGGYDGQDVFSPFLRQAHNWEAVIAHLEGFRG